MSPHDVIAQHAEATAAPFQEKVRWHQEAGLYLRCTARGLVVDDRIDLEPLQRTYGHPSDDDALDLVESEMAIVMATTPAGLGPGDYVRITTDQGEIRIPASDTVEYLPAEDCQNRCTECGHELDHAEDIPTCMECTAYADE